jgi:hypothetical protein
MMLLYYNHEMLLFLYVPILYLLEVRIDLDLVYTFIKEELNIKAIVLLVKELVKVKFKLRNMVNIQHIHLLIQVDHFR